MTAPTELGLTANIAAVPGVSPRHAEAFRRLDIRCVADLILHLPLRYEHELAEQTIAQVQEQAGTLGGEVTLSVCGEIVTTRSAPGRRGRRVAATIQDATGALRATWSVSRRRPREATAAAAPNPPRAAAPTRRSSTPPSPRAAS